jgi:hypothetical protein
MIRTTRALLEALLEMAADRDPQPMTVALRAIRAGDWAPLDADEPVLTEFYLPETGGSVAAVFGVDIATPGAAGRFLTHPDGVDAIRQTDDLHATILLAVPPYDIESVRGYGRTGTQRPIELVEATPPEATFE